MEYVLVAGTGELREGQLLAVEANGIKLLLTKVEGAYYATQRKCPYLGFNLCWGRVQDRLLVCPIHHTRYDLATGELAQKRRLPFVRRVASARLQTYPVEVNGYEVLVGI